MQTLDAFSDSSEARHGQCMIAGVTGAHVRDGSGLHGNYLFYRAKSLRRVQSFAEIWSAIDIPTGVKQAKSANSSVHGDLYELRGPSLDPFAPDSYKQPITGHGHGRGEPPDWHSDIRYKGERHRLFVGDPRRSYVWDKPSIRVPFTGGIGHKSKPLNEFLNILEPA
jgi:hypothetical protein